MIRNYEKSEFALSNICRVLAIERGAVLKQTNFYGLTCLGDDHMKGAVSAMDRLSRWTRVEKEEENVWGGVGQNFGMAYVGARFPEYGVGEMLVLLQNGGIFNDELEHRTVFVTCGYGLNLNPYRGGRMTPGEVINVEFLQGRVRVGRGFFETNNDDLVNLKNSLHQFLDIGIFSRVIAKKDHFAFPFALRNPNLDKSPGEMTLEDAAIVEPIFIREGATGLVKGLARSGYFGTLRFDVSFGESRVSYINLPSKLEQYGGELKDLLVVIE